MTRYLVKLKVKQIHKAFERAQKHWNSLPTEAQDKIREYFAEGYSPDYCARWGENSCNEILENPSFWYKLFK